MAVAVLYDAKVTVNGVVLSDHAKKVTVNYNAAALDNTTMGQTTKTNLPGLIEWSIEVEFEQDYAAANVDATLWPLVGVGVAPFTVAVQPTSAALSATNPGFSGSAMLDGYNPITGGVGEIQVFTARFLAAGTLSRLTA